MGHGQSTERATALERQQFAIAQHSTATFWHRVRFSLVAAEVRRAGAVTVVDIGAGSGGLGLWCRRHLRNTTYRWAEVSPTLAAGLRTTFGDEAELVLGDRVGPGVVIAMLDVLEHIEDDEAALRTLADSMAHDTVLVLTVPAGPGLFSSWDTSLGHFRRYTRRSLREVVDAAGLRVVRCDYLFPELLPLAARRVVGDRRRATRGERPTTGGTADFPDLPRWVDAIAHVVARSSAACRRLWPCGTSLVAVVVPGAGGGR
ncbi:MAG: class I SAM-dependent methyltransferase [Ilumatobacteraceae bacterium]